MEMARAVASPDLRAHYGHQTRTFVRSTDTHVRALAALDRARGVDRGWQRASVAVRNLLIRDALRLLEPVPSQASPLSSKEDNWSFTNVRELDEQFQHLKASAPGTAQNDPGLAARVLLKTLISRTKEDTFASFVEFKEKQENFQAIASGSEPDDNSLLKYENWIKRYRPYLVLDVPLNDENRVDEAEQMLRERMAFFLKKNPAPFLAERYTDRLWTFVYDVRDALRRTDN